MDKMMEVKKLFFVIALVAVMISMAFTVSAQTNPTFAQIKKVKVNGIENFNTATLTAGVFAGQVMNIEVTILGRNTTDDVRVIARILGEPSLSDSTGRMNILAGSMYNEVLQIPIPSDIDPSEEYVLEISVESQNERAIRKVNLLVQRGSYEIEILSADSPSDVRAGTNLPIDVVIKNRGFEESEDTFVKATILELGISNRVFLGDLSPVDQGGDDEKEMEDSVSGRINLAIPGNVPEGIYTLEIEASNDDATTRETRRVHIASRLADSRVISSGLSKTFAVGQSEVYTLTIVNGGNSIELYDLVIDADSGVRVEADESVFAIPAGSSKTVRLTATAADAGTHSFRVNVHSDNALVQTNEFVANVEGRTIANAAVLLTVVLAIIFVVLLIVLIVLLTRKPQARENSESYY